MALPRPLAQYLQKHKISHLAIPHRTVFTAYDLAQTLREKLDTIGKTLLVKANSDHILVVIPGHRRLDLGKLKKLLGAAKVVIAQEKEMVSKLKVKAGALTPFGGFHKLRVIIDTPLSKATSLVLGSGSFTDSIRMRARDFLRMESPTVGAVSSAGSLPKVFAKKPAARKRRRPSTNSSKKRTVRKRG